VESARGGTALIGTARIGIAHAIAPGERPGRSRGRVSLHKREAAHDSDEVHYMTDKKATADTLAEHERLSAQLASVALATPGVIGSFYLGSDGRVAYRYVSPKATTVFGLDPAEICADSAVFFRRLRREDLEFINEGLFRSARELSLWVVEFRFDHPEKGLIWMEAQAAPVRDDDGMVVWFGYASDITARKCIELSLAESAERLQATIDAAQDAVLTMDAAGRIQSVNRAGSRMFGYSANEIVGLNVDLIVEPEPDEDRADEWSAIRGIGERREVYGKHRDGRIFPAELTLSETKFNRAPLLVGFIKDLSAQREMEERVEELHRTRLDAMGGMAAALAHEINQPLAATAAYLKVARRLLEKSGECAPEVLDVLDKATTQTLRAGRIVTTLRDLARRGEPDKTLVAIHDLIEEAYDALQADESQLGVEIRLDLTAGKDQALADRTQVRQVLDNLVRNALEAMQTVDRPELVFRTSNPDDSTIRVDVIDTGCGFQELAEDGCFEPFTTTKAKGMGVGLSISRSIIKAHYGRIWAASNPGGGAIFSFTLPLQNLEAVS
jgi:PAS domain S-box-containing protein